MKQLTILFFLVLISIQSHSQVQNVTATDTVVENAGISAFSAGKEQSPQLYDVDLNHYNAPLGNKILRGVAYSMGYNLTMGTFLLLSPNNITMWNRGDKFKWSIIRSQYQSSFTKPPVWDKDHWYVNYVGHPYQGAYYYNNMRSQGATVLESSLFCLGQTVLWEYAWEGGMEQPSIQDLIVTPVVGSVLGELSHRAALSMGKNGYRWYEKVFICFINPTYAINNGFKRKHKPVQ
ncbi:MAG: DUF3943 domain-containing protein [Paludibacter sp.]